MNSELVVIEKKDIVTAFKKGGLDPLIEGIKKEADNFKHGDLSLEKNRKEVGSMAHKIARSKTYIDGLGKELVSTIKEQTKAIDAERKNMRDELDALKEKVRKPLTDWENEQKRIEKEAADLKIYLEEWQEAIDHDSFVNEKIKLAKDQKELAEKQAEQARIEKEKQDEIDKKRIQKEAADKARIEAEKRAEVERQAAFKRDAEAKAEIERVKQEKIKAEEKAKKDKQLAAERLKTEKAEAKKREKIQADKVEQDRLSAIKKAEDDKNLAVENEKKRVEAERLRIEKETKARAKNRENSRKINNEAKQCFIDSGFEEEDAVEIVKMIVSGKIDHVSIKY